MATVNWTNKGYTHTFNTNSRAYELLDESKKNPEKLKELEKHLKQLSENEKELIKNAEKLMTPEALARYDAMRAEQKAILDQRKFGRGFCEVDIYLDGAHHSVKMP